MAFDHLSAERFISLTTKRTSGETVATPVWFAQMGDRLVVGTFSDSGKVRRLRRDPVVQVAPCNFRGLVKGPYIEAIADVLPQGDHSGAENALGDKYGWQWKMFSQHVDTYLLIRPQD